MKTTDSELRILDIIKDAIRGRKLSIGEIKDEVLDPNDIFSRCKSYLELYRLEEPNGIRVDLRSYIILIHEVQENDPLSFSYYITVYNIPLPQPFVKAEQVSPGDVCKLLKEYIQYSTH